MTAHPTPRAVRVSDAKLGLDDFSVVNVLETTSGIIQSEASGIVRVNQPGDQRVESTSALICSGRKPNIAETRLLTKVVWLEGISKR